VARGRARMTRPTRRDTTPADRFLSRSVARGFEGPEPGHGRGVSFLDTVLLHGRRRVRKLAARWRRRQASSRAVRHGGVPGRELPSRARGARGARRRLLRVIARSADLARLLRRRQRVQLLNAARALGLR